MLLGSCVCGCINRFQMFWYANVTHPAVAFAPDAQATAAEVRQLAAADGQQAHAQAQLSQRCSELEQEVARLRLQLEDRQAEAADAAAQRLEAAVARQLQAALPAAAEQAVARWAAEALPPLLQPMQEAVAATAELASTVAAEAGSIVGDVKQLAERCSCLEAAQQQHERRLRDAESSSGGGGGTAVAAAAEALDALQEQVHALQAGHSRLDEAVSGLRHQQAAAAAAGTSYSQRRQQQQDEAVGQELGVLREQVAAVAEQQAQAAKTTENLVHSGERVFAFVCCFVPLCCVAPWKPARQPAHHVPIQLRSAAVAACRQHVLEAAAPPPNPLNPLFSTGRHSAVLTDTMALARHTKALDKELRALRKEAAQTQAALLQLSSACASKLEVASPLGPFTSFPPQL